MDWPLIQDCTRKVIQPISISEERKTPEGRAGPRHVASAPTCCAWHHVFNRLVVAFEFVAALRNTRSVALARLTAGYESARYQFFEQLPVENQRIMLEINKQIDEAGGIAAYLQLDNPSYVESLTTATGCELDGVRLFVGLISFRYQNGRCASPVEASKLG